MTEPPQVPLGDEVVYHTGSKWVIAEVLAIRGQGELLLSCLIKGETITQRATHGPHVHGWLTYEEAAKKIATRKT